ncbi:MAG: DNA polymerase Y family protein [Phycisphaeraceae bacterium]|nr:DNA polymerase Y family protein [Phycisphaeraceae bacterium]
MCIWFPNLPLEMVQRASRRSGAPPERGPVLLVRTEKRRRVVAFCCARAAAAGARPGMPAAEAMAVLPTRGERAEGVRVLPARPDREAALLRALAAWCSRLSPLVGLDPPDGLMLDIRGCAQAHGGEERMLHRALSGLAALGFAARAAVAPTFGCAWALSRFAPQPAAIVPEGGQRAALAPLPVGALRIDAATREALAELGVTHIGEALALPRGALPARFAPDLLLRIDQALGSAMETILPVREAARIAVERGFDGPTTQAAAIELCTRELLEQLCAQLTAHQRGARRIEITLDRADLEPARLTISLGRPARDPRHLWRLIRPRLERVHLGYGVERIALAAPWTAQLRHEQAERWREAASDAQGRTSAPDASRAADELIDTLANRLGPQRIRTAEPVESHLPERAWMWRPAMESPPRMHAADAPAPTDSDAPAPGERPAVLFFPPRAVHAARLVPGNGDAPVPARLLWNGVEIDHVPAERERIACEWWRSARPERDYLRAADRSGRVLWLAYEPDTGRWFVHGVWA